MLSFQYHLPSAKDASELIDTYFQSFKAAKMNNEHLVKAAGRLVFSWKPEYGRKFPTVKEFIDITGVSPSSIAKKAHTYLKIQIMKVGGYECLDLGKEHRHLVAMEAIRKMGGWFVVCQNGLQEFDRNKDRFCKEFEDLYYQTDIPIKPLLCGSDARNVEFLLEYNSNQIENN
jgi:hypothetical protein